MKKIHLHSIEKSGYLHKCELFDSFSKDDLYEISGFAKAAEYDRNEILFVKDEPADTLFIVASGKIKIYCLSPDGREQIIHIIPPGEMCAEVPMFAGGVYPANAVAMVKTTVITFSRSAFLDESRKNPEILLNMLASLSRRLKQFVNLVDDISLKDVRKRLVNYLLRNAKDNQLTLNESKKVLAGQLGTVPETLSRTLQQLQNDDLISVDGKDIRIINVTTLEDILDEI